MKMLGRLTTIAMAAVVGAGILAPLPAQAFTGVPENVRFVRITPTQVDLTFVDKSTAELEFWIEYKQLGTITWNKVRTVKDTRAGQPGLTNVTIRVNNLPHVSIGGCYKVWAVGTNVRLGTAQKCTAEVPHGMKAARVLSWTDQPASSYNGWLYGYEHKSLYTEFNLDWNSDLCSSSPDQPSGFDFRMPCRRHDFGYRNFEDLGLFGRYKSRVDDSFYADLLRKCDTYFFVIQPVCESLAWIYYQAVVHFGGNAAPVDPSVIAYHERWRADLEASQQ